MDPKKLRAWWFDKQGLGSRNAESPAEALHTSGWARSVGGANPYITIFSRSGIGRSAVDASVERLEIAELPSARGCTYLLPASDFALGLELSRRSGGTTDFNVATRHLGVTVEDIRELGDQVIEALADGPKDPAQLRSILGDAIRSFGEEGRKRGVTSTLPVALGMLQRAGRIIRSPEQGRLDTQRYAYKLWKNAPEPPQEDASSSLARLYWTWIGPAKLEHFQWFSALSGRAAKDAVKDLGLVTLDDGWLILPEEETAFSQFEAPDSPVYSLLSGLDALFLHRRDLATLVDEEDQARLAADENGLRAVGNLQDLSNNAIVDRGRIIGLWEYDPEAAEIVWTCWTPVTKELEAKIEETRNYIQENLGDARSFSLDSPKSRKSRIEALRQMQPQLV